MKLKIPIHSVVDLITNSSTEIYVAATQSTIDNIKLLVNSLLKYAGSTETADDLFIITLEEEVEDEWGYKYGRDYPTTKLIVATRKDVQDLKAAVDILRDLSGLFTINAQWDG